MIKILFLACLSVIIAAPVNDVPQTSSSDGSLNPKTLRRTGGLRQSGGGSDSRLSFAEEAPDSPFSAMADGPLGAILSSSPAVASLATANRELNKRVKAHYNNPDALFSFNPQDLVERAFTHEKPNMAQLVGVMTMLKPVLDLKQMMDSEEGEVRFFKSVRWYRTALATFVRCTLARKKHDHEGTREIVDAFNSAKQEISSLGFNIANSKKIEFAPETQWKGISAMKVNEKIARLDRWLETLEWLYMISYFDGVAVNRWAFSNTAGLPQGIRSFYHKVALDELLNLFGLAIENLNAETMLNHPFIFKAFLTNNQNSLGSLVTRSTGKTNAEHHVDLAIKALRLDTLSYTDTERIGEYLEIFSKYVISDKIGHLDALSCLSIAMADTVALLKKSDAVTRGETIRSLTAQTKTFVKAIGNILGMENFQFDQVEKKIQMGAEWNYPLSHLAALKHQKNIDSLYTKGDYYSWNLIKIFLGKNLKY